MKIKRHKMYWAPEGGEGGGAALMDQMGPLNDEAGEEQQQETQEAETETETKVDVTPAFDPNEFAKTFGASFAETTAKTAATQQQQQRAPTPEEAKKLLNVWEPDEEFLKEFNNMETQKGAMTKLRDYLIKQADTIAQVRIAEVQRALVSQFQPMVQAAQRAEAEAVRTSFTSSYKELAAPALQPLMSAVVKQLQDEGVTFKSQREGFTEVAKRMAAVIQVHNPSFKLSAAGTPAAKKSSDIPVTTPGAGGGGGTGGKGGGGVKRSALLDALGPLGT